MGGLLEYLQSLVPYRTPEIADMLANVAGILLALVIVRGKLSQILLRLEQSFKRGV